MAKLRGSTLIETLVAMTIILFCSTLAALVYSNVLSSQNTAQKTRAYYVSRQVFDQALAKKNFLDLSEENEGLRVEKKCKPYKGDNGLIWINVKVYSEKEKLLWEESRVFNNE